MRPQVLNNGEYCKLGLGFIIRIWSMTSTVSEDRWDRGALAIKCGDTRT